MDHKQTTFERKKEVGRGEKRKRRKKGREKESTKNHTVPHVIKIVLVHETFVPLFICMLGCYEKMSFLLWAVVSKEIKFHSNSIVIRKIKIKVVRHHMFSEAKM